MNRHLERTGEYFDASPQPTMQDAVRFHCGVRHKVYPRHLYWGVGHDPATAIKNAQKRFEKQGRPDKIASLEKEDMVVVEEIHHGARYRIIGEKKERTHRRPHSHRG
jgi:hypothetical protein